jgi:U3 small nucleolar RNA-associated protein 18
VNVYGADAVGAGGAEPPARPRTRKALGQLTTAISALRFSGDGQLLAIASDDKQDQLRMVRAVAPCRERSLTALAFFSFRSCPSFAAAGHCPPPPQIHTASLTAFSNWPTAGTPLGRVTDIDFAPAGGFVAVGNHRGRALLYQLRDYAGL